MQEEPKMEIRRLADDPGEIGTVARWIYEEWGPLVPGRTIETAHVKIRQSLDGGDVPLTLVCFMDGEMVGTAGIDTADMATVTRYHFDSRTGQIEARRDIVRDKFVIKEGFQLDDTTGEFKNTKTGAVVNRETAVQLISARQVADKLTK